MSELTLKFTFSGTSKFNFSVDFEPTMTSCENDNVSEVPKITSDLNTVRDCLADFNPVPSCSDSILEEPDVPPVFSVALSGVNGNVDSIFENVSEFNDNDLNSVLFGDGWKNSEIFPLLSVNSDDLSFNNDATDSGVKSGPT